MPVPALLDPNNRLLGWSASDLSLYGGQPTVTLGASQPADPGGAFVSVPSDLPADALSDVRDDRPNVVSAPAPTDQASSNGGSAAAPTALLAPDATVVPTPATAAPGVPDPVGSGSLAPTTVTAPFAAQIADGQTGGPAPLGSASFAAPVLDLAAPTATAAQGVAPALDTALVAPVVAVAADLVGTTVAVATGMPDDTLAATTTLLDGLVSALPVNTVTATLATTAAVTTGALADTAAATVDTVDAIDAATATAIGDTGDLVGAATDTVDVLAGTTTAAAGETLAATTTTVTAPVADLADVAIGGSDPAGGVATLVGMVEAADHLDLSSIGGDVAPVTQGGSILDALAADEAPAALLGVGDHGEDGLLGGLDSHDHDGGLLGGL